MAIKGLSIPTFGKYAYSQGSVTYSNGATIGHAIEYSFEPEMSDDNPLYGDNMIVEHDNGVFTGGTLTLQTSELTQTTSKTLLGLTAGTFTVGEGTGSTTVNTYLYDDSASPVTIGFGIIEEHQIDDVTKYCAVILPKCRPKFTSAAATTRGETIDWQTQEIAFSVERSDATGHPWRIDADPFTTESAAQAYLNAFLGVSAG